MGVETSDGRRGDGIKFFAWLGKVEADDDFLDRLEQELDAWQQEHEESGGQEDVPDELERFGAVQMPRPLRTAVRRINATLKKTVAGRMMAVSWCFMPKDALLCADIAAYLAGRGSAKEPGTGGEPSPADRRGPSRPAPGHLEVYRPSARGRCRRDHPTVLPSLSPGGPHRKPLDGQRVCRNCIAKSRLEECVRCGARREPATRDDQERPLCPNCLVTDPANVEICINCGKRKRVQNCTPNGPPCSN
ncbi:hypothetical protein [Streptomyces sp. CC224B]|uniref:hypothetical protein n=1 Tax=Streptomyces sp. CC224B TaxID=3044571 RepID=UPI0024A9C798|nr:hypothetical protein [Streptomyces sp. CC224B]